MKRVWMAAGLALIAACTPQAPVPPITATGTKKPFAQRIGDARGLENFAQIAPWLYRGAQPTQAGYAELKTRGIRTVVSLRSWHGDEKDVQAAGLAAEEIPLQADIFGSTPPTDEDLKKFFALILDPKKQPVYFHCAHGKDRTGTMAAICRMELDGWTPAEAIEEMQAFGYHDIYKDLIEFVRNYKPRGFAKKP